MPPLRVILVDDHALVRAGICAILRELDDVEVVAETGDGRVALELIAEKAPDVALVDISMPGLNGLEVTARVPKDSPTRVLIVSMHCDDESIRRALLAGAAGYLVKSSDRAEFELALRAVARGDTWLSPALSTNVVSLIREGSRGAPGGPFELLTSRQREVLQLIAEGLSTKQISSRLGVGVKTVEAHRNELMERLGIHGVAGLVRYAIRMGLVSAGST